MPHRGRPIPDSYWVVPGRFAAGEYPGHPTPEGARDKARALLRCGVDRVFDLTEAGEHGLLPYLPVLRDEAAKAGRELRHERFAIPDLGVPDPSPVRRLIDAIDAEVAAGHVVYVHCFGGIGRTGAVVGCWLAEHGATGDEALARIAALREGTPDGWKRSPETEAQRRFVVEWAGTGIGRQQRSRGTHRYRGCLLGGAVGDALGWPVEFLSLDAIRIRHGAGGIRDLVPATGGLAEVSDDTQMTLFTAEGLLDARDARGGSGGDREAVASVHRAYLRWLRTQGGRSEHPAFAESYPGGLLDVSRVHAVRAPGNTCLSALRGPLAGTVDAPVNDSKGCGGVMRAAPAGLFARDVASAFGLGCDVAALTHGHPSGYLSAGVLAAAVRAIVEGAPLPAALDAATAELRRRPRHEECLAALDRGRALAASCGSAPPAPEALHRLGGGWVGEEALAIAACCALAAPDFETALIAAVNHSGDSDSTGAIAGNLLGAALGVEAIPPRWLERVELRAETEALADRLRAA